MARPIDVIENALHTRSTSRTASERERTLGLPEGFVSEVLDSGGLVALYFSLRSPREIYGWTGCLTGARILNKAAAVRFVSGDSIVNTWTAVDRRAGRHTGMQSISAELADPFAEMPQDYVLNTRLGTLGVDLWMAATADEIADRVVRDPLEEEAALIDSPQLVLSRRGVMQLAEVVHPDGYLARLLPEVDEAVFERDYS